MTTKPKFVCKNCRKPLTAKMELEWSAHICEVYCSPDCATDRYYNYLGSRPVTLKEIRAAQPEGNTL